MTPKQYKPMTMKGVARSYRDNPGRLYHAVGEDQDAALCGARPGQTSAGWDPYLGKRVTCPKCQKKLDALPSDPVLDEDLVFSEVGRAMAGEIKYARSFQVDFGQVIIRAAGQVAAEIIRRREVHDPTPEQRQAILEEAGEAVRKAVEKRLKLEGTAEGQGDSADATPFQLCA